MLFLPYVVTALFYLIGILRMLSLTVSDRRQHMRSNPVPVWFDYIKIMRNFTITQGNQIL